MLLSDENNSAMKVCDALYANIDNVLLLDTEKETYRAVKLHEEWKSMLKEEGTFKELFFNLFTYQESGTSEKSGYRMFAEMNIFKKERYQGRIEYKKNGRSYFYGIIIVKISDSESALCIYSQENSNASDKIELEKINVIQQKYLFSMIVDLSEDACINPNTTEISAARQDYMDIRYSDWRMMISNMFIESDRAVFFRISSPEYIINTLEVQEDYKYELQMKNMQNRYIWVRLSFARTKNFSRECPRFVYTVRDIQKDMERLLNKESIIKIVAEQNTRLKDAERERTKFFSNMSHEIRTPINAILGMNEVILRESTEENIRSYAKDIKSSSRFLLSIVNDILDVSKIQAGKMEIVPVEYNLDDVVKEINTLVKSYIGEKNINYIVNISSELPKRFYGDEIRITQIIINLLTNAVKYTPSGSVEFSINPAKTDQGNFAMAVSVKDTGIGIKEEDLDQLFAEYGRLDTKVNRRVEGTGLGMSIVTGLLDRMDSRLEVHSVYGQGSEFSFVLPQKVVEVTEDGENSGITSFDVSDKRVLVVDDVSINLKVARVLMKPYRMKVDLANSGRMCLDRLRANKYDMILLDHMMPEMDGVETLAQIKALGDEYSNIPVVALTGNTSSNARAEYIGMGFVDYLEKPIIGKKLEALIRTYLAKK